MAFRLPLYIQTPIVGDSIIYQFGKQLWSGLTVSYRTGDERDMFNNGFFDYAPTVGQNSVIAELSNFTTLTANNSFGDTSRFTNTSGGTAATSGNRAFIDHLTGLMWYVPNNQNTGTGNWDATIDLAVSHSFAGFSDWRIPPLKIWMSVANYGINGVPLNYAPFNMNTYSYFSSTTIRNSTTNAFSFLNSSLGTIANNAKTVSTNRSNVFVRRWIP
jgi:hypothetical protein